MSEERKLLYRRELCDLNNKEEGDIILRVAGKSMLGGELKPLYPGDPVAEEHRLEYEEDKPKTTKIFEIKGRFGLGKIKIDSFNIFSIFRKKV